MASARLDAVETQAGQRWTTADARCARRSEWARPAHRSRAKQAERKRPASRRGASPRVDARRDHVAVVRLVVAIGPEKLVRLRLPLRDVVADLPHVELLVIVADLPHVELLVVVRVVELPVELGPQNIVLILVIY